MTFQGAYNNEHTLENTVTLLMPILPLFILVVDKSDSAKVNTSTSKYQGQNARLQLGPLLSWRASSQSHFQEFHYEIFSEISHSQPIGMTIFKIKPFGEGSTSLRRYWAWVKTHMKERLLAVKLSTSWEMVLHVFSLFLVNYRGLYKLKYMREWTVWFVSCFFFFFLGAKEAYRG